MIADDLGYGDVSILGNDTLPTPNIDRMGREGIKLTHHLAAASVCTPSRSAFLTGRYPIRSGMTSSGKNRVFLFVASSGGLPSNETSFAKSLQFLNYSTALFGKWHLGKDCLRLNDNCHHPHNHGYDYFYGLPLTNLKDFGDDGQSVILSYFPHFYLVLICIVLFGFCLGGIFQLKHWTYLSIFTIVLFTLMPSSVLIFQKNITFLNSFLYRNNDVIEHPILLKGLTDRLVDEASKFIREKTSQNVPFLAMINFVKVHTAHAPSDKFEGKSLYGKYGDCVMELDYGVGRILNLLQELKISDQTFTYFSSDNGGHLEEVDQNGIHEGGSNGPFRGGKGHGAMEGGIRVPSFVMWPGVFPPNKTINTPTMQFDIFTTIHSITGLKPRNNVTVDGKDLYPLLRGKSDEIPHKFMFHYCGTYLHAVRFVENIDHVWKVYFYTPKYKPHEEQCEFMCMCFGKHVVRHDPPLVYNIAQDLSEKKSIEPNSSIYKMILSTVLESVNEHQSTLSPVYSQFDFENSVWKPWLQPIDSFV